MGACVSAASRIHLRGAYRARREGGAVTTTHMSCWLGLDRINDCVNPFVLRQASEPAKKFPASALKGPLLI